MVRNGEGKQRQHFYHHGHIICHQKSGYVTTKLYGTSTCRCNIIRSLQTEQFSSFLPSMYAGHVNLAAAKLWQFLPNWKHSSTLELFFFVFKILFLPKYRVIYYDYIVKWCQWCASLDIAKMLNYVTFKMLNVTFKQSSTTKFTQY